MASEQTERSPWGGHRARIFDHAEVILDLLDRGWTAKAIRTRLDLEAVPLRTFHDNVRKLRSRPAPHHLKGEKPAEALPAEKDMKSAAIPVPSTSGPRASRKKKKGPAIVHPDFALPKGRDAKPDERPTLKPSDYM